MSGYTCPECGKDPIETYWAFFIWGDGNIEKFWFLYCDNGHGWTDWLVPREELNEKTCKNLRIVKGTWCWDMAKGLLAYNHRNNNWHLRQYHDGLKQAEPEKVQFT
jgi:hypothetical protein